MVQPPHIVVVGSINMDLVARVPRLPRPGETVHGSEFMQAPGGKGANQAVAAALLGADVTLFGRVGDDVYGKQLVAALDRPGVRTGQVQTTSSCPSGLALISVEDSGQNAITVIGGANLRLTPDDVRAREAVIRDADALLVQLEVPLETVVAAVEIARQHGVMTILDPAPAPAAQLPDQLYAVDLISPNQSEAEALTGIAVVTIDDAARAAMALHRRGVRHVVIKLGERGAFASKIRGNAIHIPAPQVNVVDTTAAGDAFTAALAVALVEDRSLGDATRFACAAGSLATTRPGAQGAMPTRAEVEALLHKPNAQAKESA
jgi:ribokinase